MGKTNSDDHLKHTNKYMMQEYLSRITIYKSHSRLTMLAVTNVKCVSLRNLLDLIFNTVLLQAVYLVDFQLTRVGSLALDLANLLYCCTSGVVRRAYMTQLLQHYHSHLMSFLRILNPEQPPKDPSIMWKL